MQKKSTSILQIVTLTSPDARYDSLYLANYATIKLKDEIARLPGVGNVIVFGAGQYSMRVWLDPNKMQARGLIAAGRDPGAAAAEQAGDGGPDRHAAGAGGQAFQYTLNVAGRLDDPAAVRRRHRQDRRRRRDHARPRRRPRRARRADLRPGLHARRQAGGGPGDLPVAGRQRAQRRAARSTTKMDGAVARISRRALVYGIPFDTTMFVERVDRRGLQDAVRGGDPGADRHPASSCRTGARCWCRRRRCR